MRLASELFTTGDRLRSRLESIPRQLEIVPGVGSRAPSFCLPDADMEAFDLDERIGRKHVVLYFYPRDCTPGCTLQALDFSDHAEAFAALDCEVVGISPDDCLIHAEFRDEHGLAQHLLSDEDKTVCRQYGVWQLREADGVAHSCVARTTFIIDKQGTIRHIFRNVAPRDHAADVLNIIKDLEAEHTHGNRKKYRRHS